MQIQLGTDISAGHVKASHTLAFEGIIKPNFLSVTDEGRAERAGFQSGEPDIALSGGRLENQGCTTIARANELVHSFFFLET